MGHGLYRIPGSTEFPWDMDRTGYLGVQDSHGPWTVQDTWEYRIPIGHGPYRTPESMKFLWVIDKIIFCQLPYITQEIDTAHTNFFSPVTLLNSTFAISAHPFHLSSSFAAYALCPGLLSPDSSPLLLQPLSMYLKVLITHSISFTTMSFSSCHLFALALALSQLTL